MRSSNYILFLDILLLCKNNPTYSTSFTVELCDKDELHDACRECIDAEVSFRITESRITVRFT